MMPNQFELTEIEKKLQLLRTTAEELKQMSDQFPALDRNLCRILASITMLEMNIPDVMH